MISRSLNLIAQAAGAARASAALLEKSQANFELGYTGCCGEI
jgi:hypothetical protein